MIKIFKKFTDLGKLVCLYSNVEIILIIKREITKIYKYLKHLRLSRIYWFACVI